MNLNFKPDLAALVLGALETGAKHGYAIAQVIRRSGSKSLKLGEGQLYPVLHKLEEAGMITAEWEPQEGRPSRRVYSMTEAGAKDLASKKRKWKEHVSSVSAVLNLEPSETYDG